MIIMLFFTCQMPSSSVIINPQTNQAVLMTTPAYGLAYSELQTCMAQTNQTAVYDVQVGSVSFRSNFTFYNAFIAANITLYPQGGKNAASAAKFVLAQYTISFLNDNLIQSGAVGQLITTYYNYNECIYHPVLEFITYSQILPIIQINPSCIIGTTGDPQYLSLIAGQLLYSKTIKQDKFDFTKLVLQGMDCASGTDVENRQCKNASVTISSSNFLDYQLYLVIPNKINTQNVYTDSYGNEKNISIEIPFNLVFSIQIQDRVTDGDCISSSQLSFSDNVIHIIQTKKTECPFQEYFDKQYWIVAQDNRGYTFQIQFYVSTPFELDDYVTCSTWEISDYGSMEDCQNALIQVSKYINHVSLSVIYKVYNEDKSYAGSYIFASTIIPGGEATAVLYRNMLCLKLPYQILSSSKFVQIDIKLSKSIQHFQKTLIDIIENENFQYPSVDNVYCYRIDDPTELLINQISFYDYFGIAYILEHQFVIKQIDGLIEAEQFWEGWIFLVSSLAFAFVYLIIKFQVEIKKTKTQNK
ncbi:hypothetical protein SS50377_22657 [Spironucleus salmonicida]|uniref:Transmembrane protein n=1 Tax=Spironucleus salmonicida TaxID=348837 RepID=V6LNN4_9EUKA|nr:hypothetical protein SS50377_22657 [Spironucleus salmonicida]|eukprot:EST45853.1 Hypothetical protein SS50377_14195 [Spironucleus salmonicida]